MLVNIKDRSFESRKSIHRKESEPYSAISDDQNGNIHVMSLSVFIAFKGTGFYILLTSWSGLLRLLLLMGSDTLRQVYLLGPEPLCIRDWLLSCFTSTHSLLYRKGKAFKI